MITRRSLIVGAVASLLAAPAIVRASSLMKVRPLGYRVGDFLTAESAWWSNVATTPALNEENLLCLIDEIRAFSGDLRRDIWSQPGCSKAHRSGIACDRPLRHARHFPRR